MRIRRFLCLLAVLPLCFGLAMGALGETEGRNIYVGDVITLEIAADGMSADAVEALFEGFEVVSLKETNVGYALSLRTFEAGEHVVRIGDKEIVIQVASTLVDIERDGIFEGGTQVIAPGFVMPWYGLFYGAAGIFAVTGGYALVRLALRRKKRAPLPYPLFQKRVTALSVASDRFLVDLTQYFKLFLEGLYPCRIIGKTTAETMRVLQGVDALVPTLAEIGTWLTECDRLKFTGMRASEEQLLAQRERLLALAAQIHTQSAKQKAGEAS